MSPPLVPGCHGPAIGTPLVQAACVPATSVAPATRGTWSNRSPRWVGAAGRRRRVHSTARAKAPRPRRARGRRWSGPNALDHAVPESGTSFARAVGDSAWRGHGREKSGRQLTAPGSVPGAGTPRTARQRALPGDGRQAPAAPPTTKSRPTTLCENRQGVVPGAGAQPTPARTARPGPRLPPSAKRQLQIAGTCPVSKR